MSSAWNPEDFLRAVFVGGPMKDDGDIGEPVEIARGLVVYGCAGLEQRPYTPLRAANDGPRRF